MRNTHKTIAESLVTLTEILEIADQTNKVAYLSMGFEIHTEILECWYSWGMDGENVKYGRKILSLSDTVGSSTRMWLAICSLIWSQISRYWVWSPPTYYIDKWFEKIDAAYKAGCIRYDGAYKVLAVAQWQRRFDRKYAYWEVTVLFYSK
jgi:hydroxymethylglutaryl-CoA lyase